jgi:hypothetical protein
MPAASRRAHPEEQIQRAVVQHLRIRGAVGLVFTHPANGGYRTAIEAAIFKGMGVRAGASDLLLWHDGKAFALELKAEGGRVSPTQKQFLEDMSGAGAHVDIVYGLDEALAVLEGWQLLRGRVS